MAKIPKELQDDFYAGRRGDLVKFVINDPVEVIVGEYKGKRCAVISIQELEPEVTLMIERGDDGSLITIPQASLAILPE